MIRKSFLITIAVLVLLSGVVVARAILAGFGSVEPVDPPLSVTVDTDAVAARLAGAIRFRTLSANLPEAAAVAAFEDFRRYLEQHYPLVHEHLDRVAVNTHSLLYRWKGTDPAVVPILVYAHMDVAPVEPAAVELWTHPPFAGSVADGFIWGRGTLDMKQSLMGLLEAVEMMLAGDFQPRGTIYLAFGHDEEIGGEAGAAEIANLLADRGVRLEFTLDEGSAVVHDIVPGLGGPAALIGIAEKGYVSLELTARAQGGHSSRPPRETAVGLLAAAINRLQKSPMPARLQPPVSDLFGALAPDMSLQLRLVLANRWLLEPLLLNRLEAKPATNAAIRTTMAPTMLQSGVKPNVLPSRASAIVNYRILPGDSIADVIAHVKAAIDDPTIEIRQLGPGEDFSGEPTRIGDVNSPSFAVLAKTIRQIFPDAAVAPSLVIGGTDSKHFESVTDNSYRFAPMRLRPDDLPRLHGVDERISIVNYETMIRFYVQLLRNAAL
jgi:carboxypeptidase PM20D1